MKHKHIFNSNTTVLEKITLNDRYFKLKVSVPVKCYENASPGHFAHVLCSEEILTRKNRTFATYEDLKNYVRSNYDKLKESHILLRRPLCIHDAYEEICDDKTIHVFEFLIRIKRNGTSLLSSYEKGDTLKILAPIGNPFNYKKSIDGERDVILVAGGMGIAPLNLLSKRLIEGGINPSIFFGLEDDFSLHHGSTMKRDLHNISAHLTIASNTISEHGYKKGFVTDVLEEKLMKMSKKKLLNTDLYACGPHLMLKRVKEIADKYGLDCEMSLEERMGCGIGACVVCVCKTKAAEGFKYKKVCIDGPVFNSKEIIFD